MTGARRAAAESFARLSAAQHTHGSLIAGVLLAVVGCSALRVPADAIPTSDEVEVAVPFHVIAHRGASALAPENTLPAFARAFELGVREVELDVRMSRDGELVLFHDPDLSPKTALSGSVADHAAETLLAADLGSWFDAAHPEIDERYAGTRIATLDALFEAQGDRLHYHVEIKGEQETIPERLLERVRAHGLERSVTITSFDFDQLARVRALDRDVAICLLLRDGKRSVASMAAGERRELLASQREHVARALEAGFSQIGVRAAALSRELVEHACAQGLEVRAWGVRSEAEMEHAIRAGANGMTIDWPERLLARLRELGQLEAAEGHSQGPCPSDGAGDTGEERS